MLRNPDLIPTHLNQISIRMLCLQIRIPIKVICYTMGHLLQGSTLVILKKISKLFLTYPY